MAPSNYYDETRYCPQCDAYVRFLKSLEASYCVECGARVRLFSQQDRKRFLRSLNAARRPLKKPEKRVS